MDLAMAFESQKTYEGRRWAEYATLCASYMESRKITRAKFIGPFGNPRINKGDRVRIMRDSIIRDTYPYRGPMAAKKSYEITVHDISLGVAYVDTDGEIVCRSPEICFVRSGGYWGYVNVRDVEKVQ